MATSKVFVFGASGHAKVVIDILECLPGIEVAFAVDDAAGATARTLCGYDVIGRDALSARRGEVNAGIVTIGDNAIRCAIAAWLTAREFGLASAVHPGATLAHRVNVGNGSVVMAGCVVNSDAEIGANVIINTGATIDHDCSIGDGAHIAPGCHLCGGVIIGARSFLGAGTIVIPGVRIGVDAVIGAGSTVTADVADGARIAGSPARPIERAK
jgi:sugar O-acyltransferase (sialic acid O-acetyltransferase NeuD family)